MTGRGAHRSATVVLSLLMVLIGVALLTQTIGSRRIESPSGRMLLGVLFLAAGLGRLYLEHRRGRGRRE